MKQNFNLYTSNHTGNAANTLYPTKVIINDHKALCEAVKHDHVCAKYKDNRRNVANFEASDCIVMDCDNDHSDNPNDWKTPEDVAKAFPDVAFMVAYSRNHMKVKNGKSARPKFHVYFPIKPMFDAEKYVAMKQQILGRFRYFDSNAVDAARFYFGTQEPNCEVFEGTKTVDELLVTRNIIPAGSRNSTLSLKAGRLLVRYGNTEEARELFRAEAGKCVPPLPRNELNSIWHSAIKYAGRTSAKEGYIPPEEYNAPNSISDLLHKVKPEANSNYSWTDIGAGKLFADCFKNEARYVTERKCWYKYEGGIWNSDVGGLGVMELCKNLANELLRYAASIEDERIRPEYIKFCAKWQNRNYRETILKDAQGVNRINMREFDADPYIFNCKNGTLNLRTMEFTEHNPEDKLTKISGAEYNKDAYCERFITFVDEICSGDKEKAKFLQKILGYGISGDTRHECMFILYGATTRNGKGTLCESVLRVLGSYGCTARPETISIKPVNNSHNPSEDIARLAGMRFANISEPERGLRLNSAQIKSMTGNDTLNARFLHENSFDFKPQFKLYINTNYLPVANDMTLFSSNRVYIIPFNRHFEQSEQDKTLKELFAKPENGSAILNWLAQGYSLLQTEGLKVPESVTGATNEYRHDSDKILQFIEDKLEYAEGEEIRTQLVYNSYQDWCRDNGCFAENSRNFNQALRSIGELVRKRPKGGSAKTTMLLNYKLVGTARPL